MSGDNYNKRKKNLSIPLSVKLCAINKLNNGVSVSEIADNLEVTTKTVQYWKKNETKFIAWRDKHDGDIQQKRKRMRNVANDLVDTATWIWFREKRAAGVPVQGSYIQAQAKIFNELLGGKENFGASNGWLDKWLKRHHIPSLAICGEKLQADIEAAEAYQTEFRNYIETEELTLDQIFHCDETGLNYKTMPMTTQSAKCKGERITVMICSNAAGTLKLQLVLIGKPHANLGSLPVYYKSHKCAWMTSNIFTEWFDTEFVPKVTEFLHAKNLPIKAVLFMDNWAAHPLTLPKNDIIVRCFPPTTTYLVQPMDHCCLQKLKMLYRQNLMGHLVNYVNRGETLTQSLNISINDAIVWIAHAWEHVSATTIRKSWNLLLPPEIEISQMAEDSQDDLVDQFCEVVQQVDEYKDIELNHVNTWFNSLLVLSPEECLDDHEIVDIVNGGEDISKFKELQQKAKKEPLSTPVGKFEEVVINEGVTNGSEVSLHSVIKVENHEPDPLPSTSHSATTIQAPHFNAIVIKTEIVDEDIAPIKTEIPDADINSEMTIETDVNSVVPLIQVVESVRELIDNDPDMLFCLSSLQKILKKHRRNAKFDILQVIDKYATML